MSNVDFISDTYTVDGLKLPMVHFESKEKDICVICIHGMCGTIIDNYFAILDLYMNIIEAILLKMI